MTSASKRKLKSNLSAYAMSGLPLIGFFLFSFIPILIALYLGFTTLTTLDFRAAEFNGFENFETLFSDSLFYKSIANTFYAMLQLPISMLLGLLIANVLNKAFIKGKKFFRALFFIPYICSTVAIAYVFRWMFDTHFGIINQIFGTSINFFLSEQFFMPIMMIILIWTGTGYYIILYQAALTSVNPSVLEAAEIDGASAVRKFVSVTLPAISPTTFYLLVMGIIGSLQTFSWFQVICAPLKDAGYGYGPGDSGITIVYYLYENAFGSPVRGGVAAAAALVLVGGILVLTVANFIMSKKWVHYDD